MLRCSSGFVPRNESIHRAYNLILGLILLALTLQFFVVIGLALLLTQGPRIFYAGERLGRGRKPFNIYKFRTLDTAKAARLTRDRVLRADDNIETPLGKYLRASRLDELPQIFNIIKGDMNVIGPRPTRPALAALQEAENPHYDVRFAVRPGLIGHTQAYMCHGSAKRLRSKLNYMLCRSHVSYAAELGIVARVGYEVLAKSARLILWRVFPALERRHNAALAQDWALEIVADAGRRHDVVSFDGDRLQLAQGYVNGPATLLIKTRSGGVRRAQVTLTGTEGKAHTLSPANDVARHYITRYLLGDPVVPPRPARRRAASEQDASLHVPFGVRRSAE
ncbi:sugar transferase [Tropicibacter naphthalenivorans]|uniref:Putative undecaprenyl-phosphate N-acetylgalactosaminyl 1-phosphate transferase n=2 Tax=Tropicibacter naphthalenivorans TaxID=441103 RepID=A0A0P1GH14_9RHOB|nr:Putative undecaprenyl-phosphate N-acetylgalactosaminyl 1-phosphate transferase [Tropicibacter naphthalenivorans]SMC47824.1 sugar transferase [Tropicibacter naphthalenivorans]